MLFRVLKDFLQSEIPEKEPTEDRVEGEQPLVWGDLKQIEGEFACRRIFVKHVASVQNGEEGEARFMLECWPLSGPPRIVCIDAMVMRGGTIPLPLQG